MFAGGGSTHVGPNVSGTGNASSSGTNAASSAATSSNNSHQPLYSNAAAEANDLDALVFEFGTSKCKFGYAGEDYPRVLESPVPLTDDNSTCSAEMALQAARMESDYEQVAQWLFDAASTRLQTRLSEHPLMVVERPFSLPDDVVSTETSDQDARSSAAGASGASATASTGTSLKKRDLRARERMVEVLMEQVEVPALFCAKSAVLACYANARTSGLVVEMGATYTSITSVHEGYAFAYPKSQVLLYGGYDVDQFLKNKLDLQLATGTGTGAAAATPATTGAIVKTFPWSAAVETKESGLCRVADGPFDEQQNLQLPKISYELPDKTVLYLGTERFSVAEQYFLPPLAPDAVVATASDASSAADAASTASSGSSLPACKRGISLPDLVVETGAMTTESELRKELFQNIVLSGGSSCFENLSQRLEREIVVSLSMFQGNPSASSSGLPSAPMGFAGGPGFSNLRVKLIAAHAQERRIGSFLGASILASLGSFHEMWMSRAEYAEHGAALIHKKCP